MDYSQEELDKINECLKDLARIQLFFRENYGVDDIFSNSKFYEIIIANQLCHSPIPGHSGSRDAKDKYGNEIEYKHFKESSSNHSWTFNDFSDNLISHMHEYSFVFSHVDDVRRKESHLRHHVLDGVAIVCLSIGLVLLGGHHFSARRKYWHHLLYHEK